jgi:hypothetical protein
MMAVWEHKMGAEQRATTKTEQLDYKKKEE